jgi:hypothetical protein
MITLFKSKIKIRILYKSGNSHEVWVTRFVIENGTWSWTSADSNLRPIFLGVDEIEAVFQVDVRVNWLRAIGLARKTLE